MSDALMTEVFALGKTIARLDIAIGDLNQRIGVLEQEKAQGRVDAQQAERREMADLRNKLQEAEKVAEVLRERAAEAASAAPTPATPPTPA